MQNAAEVQVRENSSSLDAPWSEEIKTNEIEI